MRNDGVEYINVAIDAKTDLGKQLNIYAALGKQIPYIDEDNKKLKFATTGGLYEYVRITDVIKSNKYIIVPVDILELIDRLRIDTGIAVVMTTALIIRKLHKVAHISLADFQKNQRAIDVSLNAMAAALNAYPKLLTALRKNSLPLRSYRVTSYGGVLDNRSTGWVPSCWLAAVVNVNPKEN